MTLKQKFDDVEFNQYGINTVKCEKIAEDFAIGFAEWWIDKFTFKDFIHKELKELLEIYKKTL